LRKLSNANASITPLLSVHLTTSSPKLLTAPSITSLPANSGLRKIPFMRLMTDLAVKGFNPFAAKLSKAACLNCAA
jgi:hypothetical protein